MTEGDRAVDDELSRRFVVSLPVTGASISVVANGRRQSTISATDDLAVRIDEIQFALGEGPHWDALRDGTPVSAPNMLEPSGTTWPMLRRELGALGVGCLVSLPLRLGAISIGVVDLYRIVPAGLRPEEMDRAAILARAVTLPAIRRAIDLAEDDSPGGIGVAPEMRREVHQATGMIVAQLNVSATEAFLHLQAHAFSTGRSVQDIAQDVVKRRLDFSDNHQ
jgi:hypothetical protein